LNALLAPGTLLKTVCGSLSEPSLVVMARRRARLRAAPFGIALKDDHLHGILAPNMLLSHPKLIAKPLFEHCNGLFGMAMKVKGFVVKGGNEVCVVRSIGTDEIQKDHLLLFWVSQIALCL
jgi:hypothetical protein